MCLSLFQRERQRNLKNSGMVEQLLFTWFCRPYWTYFFYIKVIIYFFSGLITNFHTFLWNGIKRTFTLMNDKWKEKWLLLLLFFSSLCHSVHSGVFLVSFWVRKTDSSSHKSVWRTKQTQSWGANSEQQSRGKDTEGPCVFSGNPGPSTLWLAPKWKV